MDFKLSLENEVDGLDLILNKYQYVHNTVINKPELFSKSVHQELTDLQGSLPLVKRIHHGLRLPEDDLIREYFYSIISEIAEIQNSIKDLLPNLHKSQTFIQNQVFSYAQNYEPYSKRLKTYRSTALQSGDGDNNFFSRTLVALLEVALPLPNRRRRKEDEKEIRETLQEFYHMNGISFKLYRKQLASRCGVLEQRLSTLRRQIRNQINNNRDEAQMNLIDGLAYQLGIRRERLSYWKRDFDFLFRQIRAVRRTISHLPQHTCWEAMFNMLKSQDQLNRYL